MKIIKQTLEIQEWPLKNIGDEKFFGYLVGIGILVRDWSSESHSAYADFHYNNEYQRYELPSDEDLLPEFSLRLLQNQKYMANKLWIKKLEIGYHIDLP